VVSEQEPGQAYLREVASGTLRPAQIVTGFSPFEIAEVDSAWRAFLSAAIRGLREGGVNLPEHAHWDWARKLRRIEERSGYQLFGVECADEIQGLMLLEAERHVARLSGQQGAGLVYVDYLSAAPWNLRSLTATPRFGSVGRVLMAAAVRSSLDLGFDGRVGLHSLPQAETFYSATGGMTGLGTDDVVEGLRYFEMTPEAAWRFLVGGTNV
jgi:hypothetical protein